MASHDIHLVCTCPQSLLGNTCDSSVNSVASCNLHALKQPAQVTPSTTRQHRSNKTTKTTGHSAARDHLLTMSDKVYSATYSNVSCALRPPGTIDANNPAGPSLRVQLRRSPLHATPSRRLDQRYPHLEGRRLRQTEQDPHPRTRGAKGCT
jgi:hypothetical protein